MDYEYDCEWCCDQGCSSCEPIDDDDYDPNTDASPLCPPIPPESEQSEEIVIPW